MFRRTKRTATKKWHAKAMLVDPRKTKLTIINGDRPDMTETAFEERAVCAPTESNIQTLVACDFPDNNEIAAEIFGTPVSFVLVEEYES